MATDQNQPQPPAGPDPMGKAKNLFLIVVIAAMAAWGWYKEHSRTLPPIAVLEFKAEHVAALVLLAALVAGGLYTWVRLRYRRQTEATMAWTRIILSRDDTSTPIEVTGWFDALGDILRGRYWSAVSGNHPAALSIIRTTEGEIQLWLAAPRDLLPRITSSLQSVYTNLRFESGRPETLPGGYAAVATVTPRRLVSVAGFRSYRDYQHSVMESLIQVMDGLTGPAMVQISLAPMSDRYSQRLRKIREQYELGKKAGGDQGFSMNDQAQLSALSKASGRAWFRTEIRLASGTADQLMQSHIPVIQALLGALNQVSAENAFEYHLVLLGKARNYMSERLLSSGMPGFRNLFTSFAMPSLFLATIWQIPSARLRTQGLTRHTNRRVPAVCKPSPKDQAWVNDEDGRGFSVWENDRKSNTLTVGQQGTGKSTVLEQIVRADAQNRDKALIIIDPKGQLAERVRGYIPPDRPAAFWRIGGAQSWGFNPFLSQVDPYLTIDSLLHDMTQVWGEQAIGPRSADILRNVFAAVYQLDRQDQGFAGAASLLEAWPTWGSTVLPRLPQGPVRDWFRGRAELWAASPNLGAESVSAPANKLGALLFSPLMRSALAPQLSLDLDRVIRDRGVLVVSLSAAEVGDESAAITGVILLSAIWQSLRRVGSDAPVATSIVLDEAHRLVCESFSKLLAEGRAFGAQSSVGFQFWGQIKDPMLQGSMRELLQNLFLFRTSMVDEALQASQLLARVYGNMITPADEGQDRLNIGPDDLTNLPNYRTIVRLVQGGNPQPPFLGTTIPLSPDPARDEVHPWGQCPEQWLSAAGADDRGPDDKDLPRTDVSEW